MGLLDFLRRAEDVGATSTNAVDGVAHRVEERMGGMLF